MGRERTPRQPAGPGRTVRRPRTPKSATSAVEQPAASPQPRLRKLAKITPKFRDFGLTRRALVLVGVLAILALSYANSLRIMLNQQRDLAAADAQIAQRTQKLGDLEAQLQRWRDPSFIKAQARTQLGWVLPGEVGYRVIGADGKVIDDDAASTIAATSAQGATKWTDRLIGSVQAADAPAKP